jgi:lipopolysaccharide transport system ATP-binding protein
MRYLREFMREGTLLFCSHDIGAVVGLCSRAMLLESGRVAASGHPKDVVDRYLEAVYAASQQDIEVAAGKPGHLPAAGEYRDMREAFLNSSNLRNDIEVFRFDPEMPSFGSGAARIENVRLLDTAGRPLSWVVGGEDVVLEISCRANLALWQPIVGFHFRDRLGQVIFGENTFVAYRGRSVPVFAGALLVARFDFRLPRLPSGDYSISPAVAEGTQDQHVQHHWQHDALMLRVHATSVCYGLVGLAMRNISLEVA